MQPIPCIFIWKKPLSHISGFAIKDGFPVCLKTNLLDAFVIAFQTLVDSTYPSALT